MNGLDLLYFSYSLGVSYPGIDYLRHRLNKAGIQNKDVKVAVLDCKGLSSMDYTALKVNFH